MVIALLECARSGLPTPSSEPIGWIYRIGDFGDNGAFGDWEYCTVQQESTR